ncbi:MAG TPA: hypothetical protein VLT62_11030 [Candidatus Methylomirabilis sp.]|nr:hypothetical protein [Candidatus Methylomirabilis sp.]
MKSLSVAAALLVFLAIPLDSSAEQVDLSRALVGTWEGDLSCRSQSQSRRVLIIETVHEQDGRWVVDEAKYGRPGGYVNHVAVALKTRGTDLKLEFGRPPHDGHFSLEFVRGDTLAGTVLTHLGGYARVEFRKTR